MKKTVAEMLSEFLRQGALVLIAIMPLGDWIFRRVPGPVPWQRIAVDVAVAGATLALGITIERLRQGERSS